MFRVRRTSETGLLERLAIHSSALQKTSFGCSAPSDSERDSVIRSNVKRGLPFAGWPRKSNA